MNMFKFRFNKSDKLTGQIFKFIIILPVLLLFLILPFQAVADGNDNNGNNTSMEEICAQALVNLKIMMGDENGNLKLGNDITRCEFITLVNRMMAYEYEDEDETGMAQVKVPFTDITEKHWAYKNILIALKHSLIKGYTDNTIRPDNKISFIEAKAVILRAFGYDEVNGKWPDSIIEKSKDIGLNKNLNIPEDKLITRGEAAILIYNALTVNFIK